MKKKLTLKQQKKITIKNLKKVLRELPKLAKKIPEIKQDFNMEILGVYKGLEKENLKQCKTVGCLLGNAARVFVDEFTDDLFIDNIFNYTLFGQKFFPYLYESYDYLNIRLVYLFNDYWAKTKFYNLDSALQRIENLLKNDLECKDFDFETNKIIK